jgi:predicted DNA-binding transcriptional regulator YafY
MSATAIAAELGISERTVRRDVARNASRATAVDADVEDGIPA